MKKIKIMMAAMFLFFSGMAIAQQQQQFRKMQNGMQEIFPVIEQQQSKLVQALTEEEKTELREIRKEMADFRQQGAQMRKAMQGHFNQQAWDARKAQFEAIVAKARKLVDTHPAAAQAYKDAVRKTLAKVQERMANGGGGNHAQGMKGKNPHGKLEKLADPAYGLLFDAEAMQQQMQHHMQGRGRMVAKNGINHKKVKREFPKGGMSREFMMAVHNPKVREALKAYREKNIMPVVVRQRKAFDRVLSNKERKTLAEARANLAALREKMMQNRKAGAPVSDSAKLALRYQMDKSKLAIQQIVLKHYSELQKALAPVREKMPQWRNDMRKIVESYIVEQRVKQMAHRPDATGTFMQQKGDMMFLLLDPDHPENNEMFRLFGGPKK